MTCQKYPLYCTWDGVFRIDRAAGGEGDSWCVVLLVLLPAAVEQQESQQQDHQDDEHNDATNGPPWLPLTGGKRNHYTAWLLRGVCQTWRWKENSSTATRTAFNKPSTAGIEQAERNGSFWSIEFTNGLSRQWHKVFNQETDQPSGSIISYQFHST